MRQLLSLQAQREACESFIDSQRHEGWVCLRAAYDDGGFSGATMDRPALQQLLADVTAGRVDTVNFSSGAFSSGTDDVRRGLFQPAQKIATVR